MRVTTLWPFFILSALPPGSSYTVVHPIAILLILALFQAYQDWPVENRKKAAQAPAATPTAPVAGKKKA